MKKSSTAGLNKAQHYGNEKFQYLDLNSVLGIFFKKLNGLQKYSLKRLSWSLMVFTIILLKIKTVSVSEITKEIKSFSILILTPPPLDYKRQEYLYHNICPFVRDEFKDLTCPQPIYTGNDKFPPLLRHSSLILILSLISLPFKKYCLAFRF